MAYRQWIVVREIVASPPPAVESMTVGSSEVVGGVSAVDSSTARWLATDRYPCHPWERLRLVRPDGHRARRAAVAMEKRDLGQYVAFARLMEAVAEGRVYRGQGAGSRER